MTQRLAQACSMLSRAGAMEQHTRVRLDVCEAHLSVQSIVPVPAPVSSEGAIDMTLLASRFHATSSP